MSIAISKENISLISGAMQSRDRNYSYIDRETGEFLPDSQDYPLEIIPNEEAENYEELEIEFNRRYLKIPQEGSGAGYQDMINFIETVEDHGCVICWELPYKKKAHLVDSKMYCAVRNMNWNVTYGVHLVISASMTEWLNG